MLLGVAAMFIFLFILSVLYDFQRIYRYICARETRLRTIGEDFELERFDMKTSRVMDRDNSAYLKSVNQIGAALEKDGNHINGMLSSAPPSVVKVVRESIVMVGGSAAVLEQMMHPYIAVALKKHSYFLGEDGFKRRFYRTFQYVFDAMYGHWKDVYRSVSTVRRTHSRINGEIDADLRGGYYKVGDTFDALNEQAAFWVYATLMDNSVCVFETCCGELLLQEKEELYLWHRKNLPLWDIRPQAVPKDWNSFCRYFAAMCHSNMLAPTEFGCKYAKMLLRPIGIEKYIPGMNSGRLIALLMTPKPICDMMGLHRTQIDFLLGIFVFAVTSTFYRWLPGPLRYFSRFNLRAARMTGRPGKLSFLETCAQRLGIFIIDQTLGEPPDREAKKHQ